MITLYVIQSVNKKFRYVGITNDLDRRVSQHNKGKNVSTKNYKPFYLIYTEKFINYKKAREKEIFYKSGFGRKVLDNLNI